MYPSLLFIYGMKRSQAEIYIGRHKLHIAQNSLSLPEDSERDLYVYLQNNTPLHLPPSTQERSD